MNRATGRPGRARGARPHRPYALAVAVFVSLGAPADASAQEPEAGTTPEAVPFVLPDSIPWRSSSPGLAFALVAGSTTEEGAAYGLLARIDDGAWIPPHWHPGDKHVLVVSGVLRMGAGASADPAATRDLPAGAAATVPARTVHYEGARGETVVLFHGVGPLATTFVDGS